MFFKKMAIVFALLAFLAELSFAVLVKESDVILLQNEIIHANKLNKKGTVQPGDVLRIEIEGVYLGDYMVKPGESVYLIAKGILMRGEESREQEKNIKTKSKPLKGNDNINSLTPSQETTETDRAFHTEKDERGNVSELVKDGQYWEAVCSINDKASNVQKLTLVLMLSIIVHCFSFLRIRALRRLIFSYESKLR
jgi:hypothetical protein